MENILLEIGLTSQEAKTYLASLSLGPTSVAHVSQKTGLPRSSSYLLLEQLIKLGLVSLSSIGKKTLYVASPPKKLLEILDAKRNGINSLQLKLESSLPQFDSLYNAMPQKPKVLFYEGLEGIKTIFNDTLKAGEILVLCSGYNKPIEKKLDDYLNSYFAATDQKQIATYEIIGGGLDSHDYQKQYSGKLHQIKIAPYQKNLEHIDKMIFGDKVAIVSFVYLNGVIIENGPIARYETSLFWDLWKAKPSES